MIRLWIITQSALCQMQHNTWQRSHYSASLTAPKLMTACKWRTNVRWKCVHSILLAAKVAYKRLAQGPSRSVSAFLSFMREYLDPVVKADQCAQYVDDIGSAANNATDLTRNIGAVFKCFRQAGLKLTIEKCRFGIKQVEFLGRTLSAVGVSPQSHKIQNFLSKLRISKSKKVLQRYLGFVNYYRKYIPRIAEKLKPFYKLLKTEVPINITSELKETFDSVNKALNDACELSLN